jgi:16S rRNA (uracil1498-N3)-methyltransferase
VDRRHRAALATFFADERLAPGASLMLPEEVARHIHVRRLREGDVLRLTNGRGAIADATRERLPKDRAVVTIGDVADVPRPPHLGLLIPVADRERMLWLAEKAAELAVTSWQPVHFERSASVSPRGEGEKFAQKVRARMIGAIEQSGGGWIPDIAPELSLADALVRSAEANRARFLLERGGEPLVDQRPVAADLLLGPEGGIEPSERELIVEEHGWLPASLAETTLRFETAGVVAAGVLRALMTRA